MITAILNRHGGSAEQARNALNGVEGFTVKEVEPEAVSKTIQAEIQAAPARIAISGGDGTICSAASAVTGTNTALAILPGGTLNHFAKDHGIPTNLNEAVQVAATGRIIEADVAYAGDRLFLNTSSVGAYVSYVRVREKLEQYVGYRLASLAAAIRLLFTMKTVAVELEVEGKVRHYRTPLVFIGVGERELQAPHLGSRLPGGRSCLHVIVVRGRSSSRLMATAFAAAARGVESIAKTPQLDSYFVDRCTIGVPGRTKRVALDGEIVRLKMPVEYRLAAGALKIVVPATEQETPMPVHDTV